MRTQPRITAVVTRWTLGVAALIAALTAGGCATNKSNAPAAPGLSATVAGLGAVTPGQVGAQYTITVTNTGTAPTSGMITVVDPPTNFTVTAISWGTSGTCTFATLTCTNTNVLAAGASFPVITVTGNVTGVAGSTISVPIGLSGGGTTTTTNTTGAVSIVLAPTITSANHATFTAGTAGTFTATATGFPAPTFSTTSTLPTGVTLSTAGVLSGTPGAATGGIYSITVTAQNGITPNATQSFTLTVDQAPAITSANSTAFNLGSQGTFTVTATGFPAATLSETGALPAGVLFNAGTGVLSGTPGVGTQGSYPITITAQNGIGTNATQNFTLTVDLAPAITSQNNATFTAGAAGTFTVTTTGFPAPTFTETGALPTGVALNATTGVLGGTPGATTGAVYSITITAQNGVTPNASQSFTLTVDQAPAFTSQNNATFTVGSLGTFTATASGFPAPTFSETGALPTGISLSSAGVLSGTPGVGTQGSYPITITAQNGIGTPTTQNFTLAVDLAPTITSGNSTTFTASTPGTFTVTAAGFPAPTFSETGPLPSGVALNSTTGLLSGTPAATTGAMYPIVITASNGVGTAATQNFTLTVDQAPAITSQNSATFVVGSLGTFTAAATGFPAPTFSETGALPTGVTLNSTTGVLSGTPGTPGSYPLTITAQNGIGTPATQSFTLTVDVAPAITSGNSTTFTTGTSGTFTVTATGTPAPTFSETGALPSGVTLNSTTGVLSGTPGATTGAAYPLTITAQNGIGTPATQSFTLTVDQAPAITSANNTTFAVGSLSTFTVTATGFPAPTFGETGTLPTGVTFNSSTGVLSGTPATGTQTQSPYAITVTAQNGVGTAAMQSFTLTVSFTAPPSFTSLNSTTFTAGASGTFTVTASGSPAPTFSETGALPTGVTLNSTTGVLSGTPGTPGSYPITITAHNGIGTDAMQSFTLTVDQAPAITSQNNTTFTAGAPGTFTATATGFPAPTFSEIGSLPSGVTLNSTTGVLSGTPGAATGAAYTITITATNGVGAPATQVFTLTVNQAPAITSQNNATFTAGTAGTFTVTTTGFPVSAFSETGALPSGVTLNATTGVLSGTPVAGTGRVYTINITAQNGVTPNATQSFTLTVDEAPSFTSQNGTTFVVSSQGTFTVAASGFPAPTFSETGGLPSGVTLSSNGTLSGTPGAGTTGSYPITITAQNGVTPNATQSFTLTVATGLPTTQIVTPAAPPLQAGGATRSFTINVTNDQAGDMPSVTSFTLAGVACTPSTCGSFGAVTGTAGSGSYSMIYTPPPSLTAGVSPTVTVSPSVAGPWFAGTTSFAVNPAGVVVTFAATNGLSVVQTGSTPKTFTVTVYNDTVNSGVGEGVAIAPLTASGYACSNLSPNSCGILGTPAVSTSGTTTTTTVTYTPPTGAIPNEPYDRPLFRATSVADPTKAANISFLLSPTALPIPLSIPFPQKFDSALTGGASVTVAANFTDTTNVKSANWTITANGATCAAPTCGTLGTPVVTSNGNAVTSTVTYTPPASVPTGAGQSSPTITATMTASPTATDSFGFQIVDGTCGTGKNSLLSGSYAFLLRGGSATGGYFSSIGSFTADGNGNITGGLRDNVSSTGSTLDGAITGGSYSVGSDNRGCLTLTISNGTSATYRIALGTTSGSTATQGTMTLFIDTTGQGNRATGVLKLQNLSNVTSATFNGTYAFGREGVDSTGHRFAVAGLLTSNGAGTISGLTGDFDDNGSIGTFSAGSGSYSLATNPTGGRGTAQTTVSGVTSNYVAYVISASDFFVMSTDSADASHPIQSGENKLQTGPFSTSVLNNGGYVFYAASVDSSSGGSDTVIGQSQFTTNGNATVTLDENDNGISQPEGIGAAVFTVASSGRMTATGLGSNPPVFYLVDSTQGFIIGTDNSVAFGYVQKQSASSFTTATITGQFFFGGGAPTTESTFDSGAVNFTPGTPTGTITGTDDSSGPNYNVGCTQNCGGGGLSPNNPISGNGGSSAAYAFQAVSGVFTPTAPGQGNIGGGSVAYIISPSKVVFMQTGTSQNTNPAEIFILQQ